MILILIRGLSASGKSSLSTLFDGYCFAADDYFTDPLGAYNFDPSKLPEAHAECQRRTKDSLAKGRAITVVTNTFSCRWEMEPYFKLAEDFDCRVHVIDLFDGGLTNEELVERNLHGVPVETISDMRDRWEHNWKDGNPIPPWER